MNPIYAINKRKRALLVETTDRAQAEHDALIKAGLPTWQINHVLTQRGIA